MVSTTTGEPSAELEEGPEQSFPSTIPPPKNNPRSQVYLIIFLVMIIIAILLLLSLMLLIRQRLVGKIAAENKAKDQESDDLPNINTSS